MSNADSESDASQAADPRGASDDAGLEREQAESLARVEAGHIPLSAERRLDDLREHGVGSFTSDLSINGFALCDQLGLTPLSQVMGSSIYQMGYQSAWAQPAGGFDPSTGTFMVGLDTLSDALNEVRTRALDRLAEEALRIDASAVVGVETRAGESELGSGAGGGQLVLEHMVLGTAVRRADSRRDRSSRIGQPVLTELSVADYALLLRAGIEPAGIVAWSAVFFAGYSFGPGGGLMSMGVGGAMQNFELSDFTQAFYSARESVMTQITRQADSLGAAGVVGVRIGHTARQHTLRGGIGGGYGAREIQGLMVTFNAIGTAIHQHDHAAVQAPEPVLDLFA